MHRAADLRNCMIRL